MSQFEGQGELRLGYVPGATPGKWAQRWADRFPKIPLKLIQILPDQVSAALAADELDAAITWLPVDKTTYHAIPLYRESLVAVIQREHLFAALELAETITFDDLSDELVFLPQDQIVQSSNKLTVLPGRRLTAYRQDGSPDPAAPPPAPQDAAEAMQWVAAGTGLTILPKSLARLNHRKDVTVREIAGIDGPEMGLIWLKSHDGPLLQELAGTVRGRGANSTRGGAASSSGGVAAKSASPKSVSAKSASPKSASPKSASPKSPRGTPPITARARRRG